jgi:hypothetical protein
LLQPRARLDVSVCRKYGVVWSPQHGLETAVEIQFREIPLDAQLRNVAAVGRAGKRAQCRAKGQVEKGPIDREPFRSCRLGRAWQSLSEPFVAHAEPSLRAFAAATVILAPSSQWEWARPARCYLALALVRPVWPASALLEGYAAAATAAAAGAGPPSARQLGV